MRLPCASSRPAQGGSFRNGPSLYEGYTSNPQSQSQVGSNQGYSAQQTYHGPGTLQSHYPRKYQDVDTSKTTSATKTSTGSTGSSSEEVMQNRQYSLKPHHQHHPHHPHANFAHNHPPSSYNQPPPQPTQQQKHPSTAVPLEIGAATLDNPRGIMVDTTNHFHDPVPHLNPKSKKMALGSITFSAEQGFELGVPTKDNSFFLRVEKCDQRFCDELNFQIEKMYSVQLPSDVEDKCAFWPQGALFSYCQRPNKRLHAEMTRVYRLWHDQRCGMEQLYQRLCAAKAGLQN